MRRKRISEEVVNSLPLGVYRIHYLLGGSSVASVGQTESGQRWVELITTC